MGAPKRIGRMFIVYLLLISPGLATTSPAIGSDEASQAGASKAAPADLAKLLQEAKESFQPISQATVAKLKAEVMVAMDNLETFIGDEADDGEAWKSHLAWDSLTAELTKETPSLAVLDASRRAFHEDVDGLEREQFLDARAALLTYMNALLFSRDAEQTKKDHVATVDNLINHLKAYAESPDSETAIAVGRSLGWLERARQSPQVVAAVRQQHSYPNLFAEVSHRLFTAGIDSEVSQSQQVSSYILGTSIYGTADVSGRITSAFVPDPDRAAFDLQLTGNIYSNNVGYNGPVTIYSTASTSVEASKRVYFDAAGLLMDFAWARCATGSNIHSIAARSCLVRKIAWNRAAQSKTTAERLAAGQAQQRVAGNFDEQTAELMAEPVSGYEDKFRKPLLRRGGFPKVMKLSTLVNRLTVKMLQENQFQMAAPTAPPAMGEGHDVAVRVHESLIGNYSETLLGGVQVTDVQMVQMYVDANREVPKELVITEDSDPWAITFAASQPISVRFQDEGVHIEVRCKSLHRGEDYPRVNLAGEIRIAADYKLDVTDGGIQLVRPEGNVQIDFLNNQGNIVQGLAQTVQKGFLQGKFNGMLKPRLPEERSNGIKLQGRWEKAGKLVARETKLTDGWLILGLAQVPPADAEAGADVASRKDPGSPVDQSTTDSADQPVTTAAAAPAANETAGIE